MNCIECDDRVQSARWLDGHCLCVPCQEKYEYEYRLRHKRLPQTHGLILVEANKQAASAHTQTYAREVALKQTNPKRSEI